MLLDRRQRLDAVMGEHEGHRTVANLPAEFLQDQSLQIRLVIDEENGRGHAACSSLVSISWRNSAKSIGLVKRPIAPFSIALRRGFPSPLTLGLIPGTSGPPARPFARLFTPPLPGT